MQRSVLRKPAVHKPEASQHRSFGAGFANRRLANRSLANWRLAGLANRSFANRRLAGRNLVLRQFHTVAVTRLATAIAGVTPTVATVPAIPAVPTVPAAMVPCVTVARPASAAAACLPRDPCETCPPPRPPPLAKAWEAESVSPNSVMAMAIVGIATIVIFRNMTGLLIR